MPHLDVGLDLLDREVVDSEDETVGKVDDVELDAADPNHPPRIVALRMGPVAYGQRVGGRLGRWIERGAQTISGTQEPILIPMSQVESIDVSVKLKVSLESLDRPTRVERWLRERFIGRIPGAHREAE